MQLLPTVALDIRAAEEVFGNDVWQDEQAQWWECAYEPVPDGYMSTRRRLLPYSQTFEAALELKEEVFRRTQISLQSSITKPQAMCFEALSLNGKARYRPSEELIERIRQARWEEAGRWRVSLQEVLYGPYGRRRAAHVYIVICEDQWLGDGVLYVGQTTVGVKKRIRQHISQQSPIGARMLDGLRNRDRLLVEVVSIKAFGYDSLNAAESYFIETLAPTYNVAGMTRIRI